MRVIVADDICHFHDSTTSNCKYHSKYSKKLLALLVLLEDNTDANFKYLFLECRVKKRTVILTSSYSERRSHFTKHASFSS